MGKTRGIRGGYTLVELTVAVMVMTITLGGICSSLLSTVSLSRTNHQTSVALDAARSRIEAMRGEIFEEIFLLYNADPQDDPDGPGTGPGNTFSVAGLDPQRDDPDGFVGEITFPGDGFVLLEEAKWNDPELGMPRDLNSDGSRNGANRANDYTVLPVRVTVEWLGAGTNQRVDLVTTLSMREATTP